VTEGKRRSATHQALGAMLAHAASHSPYYRDQEWARRARSTGQIIFNELPITPKAVVKAEPKRFHSVHVPESEGGVVVKHTSGSTGEPMAVPKTRRHMRINTRENARLMEGWDIGQHRQSVHVSAHDEHGQSGQVVQRDLSGDRKQWRIYTEDSNAVFELLLKTGASHVTTFPTIALGVLERSLETSRPLALTLISTVSEIIPEELRRLVGQQPGRRLVDCYGCVEAGLIAVQCSNCGSYHLADRHLITELVTETGQAAKPGDLARVLVTPLFNRAMPLLRYETGDYAILSEKQDCPRSSLAISRIVGRERNLFRLPDGRRISPGIPASAVERLGLRRFELLQTTPTGIDFIHIVRDPAIEVPQAVLQQLVDDYLAPGFRVRSVRVEELPRSASGKNLMHESLV
jgi:phenylacetate-CoA ligase